MTEFRAWATQAGLPLSPWVALGDHPSSLTSSLNLQEVVAAPGQRKCSIKAGTVTQGVLGRSSPALPGVSPTPALEVVVVKRVALTLAAHPTPGPLPRASESIYIQTCPGGADVQLGLRALGPDLMGKQGVPGAPWGRVNA